MRSGWNVLVAAALVAAPAMARAQTATVSGSLGNFDVVNNVEQEAHGFEVELEGLQPADVYYTFMAQRYGAPDIVPYATGVHVRWTSPYDAAAGQFTRTTVAHVANTPFAGSCYQWGTNYDAAGCEHFGVSLRANATKYTYRWLVADLQNPGALVAVDPPLPVAGPIYTIQPPVQAGAPPVLVAEVEAPEPAEAPELYGDAQWMKVFKTQLTREVLLDELVTDNPMVPQDASHAEVSWQIIQVEPPTAHGNRRRTQNQGGLDANTRAVVRRYELYTYTGAYDPITHEALCADLTCTAPSDGELGDFLSAQMTAANVVVPSVSVTTVGGGAVSSADRAISCGSKCVQFADAGATVTLTASAKSGSVFTGWSGACSGTSATCALVVDENLNVGATFAATFTLSVGRSNKGVVTSDGGDIACGAGGGACSAKVAQGSIVTLTATPPAGAQFLGWSGACSGTARTCEIAVTANTSVQANFSK